MLLGKQFSFVTWESLSVLTHTHVQTHTRIHIQIHTHILTLEKIFYLTQRNFLFVRSMMLSEIYWIYQYIGLCESITFTCPIILIFMSKTYMCNWRNSTIRLMTFIWQREIFLPWQGENGCARKDIRNCWVLSKLIWNIELSRWILHVSNHVYVS